MPKGPKNYPELLTIRMPRWASRILSMRASLSGARPSTCARGLLLRALVMREDELPALDLLPEPAEVSGQEEPNVA